jgi:hypothetical protein
LPLVPAWGFPAALADERDHGDIEVFVVIGHDPGD